MKILRDFKNNLLKRKEIEAELESESNPEFTAISKMVAEHFKAKEGVIAVKKIGSRFGDNKFRINAFIYDSAEAKSAIEPEPKLKKVVDAVVAPAAPVSVAGGAK